MSAVNHRDRNLDHAAFGPTSLCLYSNVSVPYILEKREFGLRSPVWLVMSYGPRTQMPDRASVQHDFDTSIAGLRVEDPTQARAFLARLL